ncbi:MAG: hypothetical protein HC888_05590 [Candidatus Competibacteraceae bacterium]|nr:hypothetical protein [Candidatus Competibacteraceae bacterium]
MAGLEAEGAKIPPTVEAEEHRQRAQKAREQAVRHIADLQLKPVEMYETCCQDFLEPGRLLVPHWPGYWSLPWRSEELPTLLQMLTLEAEALVLKASAEASLAKANWLLAQLAVAFAKEENTEMTLEEIE